MSDRAAEIALTKWKWTVACWTIIACVFLIAQAI